MSDNQIRFIDPHYNALFTIPDGGSVVITYPDGGERVAECKYLDECHTAVDGQGYHICQFAEIMQRTGATVGPETLPEVINGSHIVERRPAGDKVIKLGYNPSFKKETEKKL